MRVLVQRRCVSCLSMLVMAAFPALRAQAPTKPMSQVLQPLVDRKLVAGAVTVVASGTKILDAEAVGYRSLESKDPMKVRDLFWIASMSKSIAATALMMLVDEGKVHLDDPVYKYLPEFQGQQVLTNVRTGSGSKNLGHDAPETGSAAYAGSSEAETSPITIRELLSHTSGLRGASSKERAPFDVIPLRKSIPTYAVEPLLHQPGTFYNYSNEGINTIGRIVEVVSRERYDRFLQQRIFTPLGMIDTTFWPTPAQLSRLALSYVPGANGNLLEVPIAALSYPLSDRRDRQPWPAGGLFSTAFDMARFCQMLLDGGTFRGKRYLSASSVKLMTTKETPPGVPTKYGFGLVITPTGFQHAGAYQTMMIVNTKLDLVIVFMVQKASPWPPQEWPKIRIQLERQAETLIGQ